MKDQRWLEMIVSGMDWSPTIEIWAVAEREVPPASTVIVNAHGLVGF